MRIDLLFPYPGCPAVRDATGIDSKLFPQKIQSQPIAEDLAEGPRFILGYITLSILQATMRLFFRENTKLIGALKKEFKIFAPLAWGHVQAMLLVLPVLCINCPPERSCFGGPHAHYRWNYSWLCFGVVCIISFDGQ